MQIHNLIQGTPEWDQFRLEHFGASEAAAMMGLSKNATRNELLAMKHSGLAKEFSAFVQERILDHGHVVEGSARPITEGEIGEDLFPVVVSDGDLSASIDGLTIGENIAWEHKQWSESLAASVREGILPDEHQPQCQQILYITNAEYLIFTVSDGSENKRVSMKVFHDEKWTDRILAGWQQFADDLADYVPFVETPRAIAAPVKDLPMVSIRVDGSISLVSNLDKFGALLNAFIAGINQKPDDDQGFADAEAAVKSLKEAEERLQSAESNALSQTASIDEMRRTVKLYFDTARTTRLALEKMVASRKETIKTEIVTTARNAYAEHITKLNDRLGRNYIPTIAADFAGAIKGKRTIASLREAVNLEMARVKIESNAVADKIDANLRILRERGAEHKFLFADTGDLVLKDVETLGLLIADRIAKHDLAEAAKAEALRVKIEAQERAKAEAAAAETLRIEREADEARRRQADAEARVQAESIAASTQAVLGAAQEVRLSEPADAAPAQTSLLTAVASSPTPVESSAMVNLGMINAALGFTVSAEFLTKLGYPFTQDRNAKLYRESDLRAMYEAIARHVLQIAGRELKSAA